MRSEWPSVPQDTAMKHSPGSSKAVEREHKELAHEEEDKTTSRLAFDFRAEGLYDKDEIDLETILIDKLSQCTEVGLDNAGLARRLEPSLSLQAGERGAKPLLPVPRLHAPSIMVMEAAALVAISPLLSVCCSPTPSSVFEEHNAGNAFKMLMTLAPKAKVQCDSQWDEIESSDHVPALNVSIDRAPLTGESLPIGKKIGDQHFSSSPHKQGETESVVIFTGANTFVGRVASLVGKDDDIIGLLSLRRFPLPLPSGPTVLSVTLPIGTQQLVKYKTIVIGLTAPSPPTMSFSLPPTDIIDACVVGTLGHPARTRAANKLLDFRPFNSVNKRAKKTYRENASRKFKRSPGNSRNRLEADVEEVASRGLRALAVASEEVELRITASSSSVRSPYPIPSGNTKQTIEDDVAVGVCVEVITDNQLGIAKENSCRLGVGNHMYPAKMILDADGFAGVSPQQKYELVKLLQGLGHLCAMGVNDASSLSRANVGIAVEGATDAVRSAPNIVLTERGLSTIIHAIRESLCVVVCFAVLAFAFKFDFPPFMVLITALLNGGTIMTMSVDHVLFSNTRDSWSLAETIHTPSPTLSTLRSPLLYCTRCCLLQDHFFRCEFGVTSVNDVTTTADNHNNSMERHSRAPYHRLLTPSLCFASCSHPVDNVILEFWYFLTHYLSLRGCNMLTRALEKRIRYNMKAGCTCIGDEEFAKRWMADIENLIIRWLDATHGGDSMVFWGVAGKYRIQFRRYRSRPWFKIFERNVKCFRLSDYTGPEDEHTREEGIHESIIMEINCMRSAAATKIASILKATGFAQSSVPQGTGISFGKIDSPTGQVPLKRKKPEGRALEMLGQEQDEVSVPHRSNGPLRERLMVFDLSEPRPSRRFIGVPQARWSSHMNSDIQNLQPQKGRMYVGSMQSIREWDDKHGLKGKLAHTSSNA
ncbi:hypothetical protein NM688_g7931 [Phlebia brevispora]|uniref:Uncharacterized protein n=1 Tax=Phlebia brevispora TaxID=194682 RepID=A0ACC1RZL1_9APHY|nr:hypothetical protein NM688_g7931 [Phlebia brevispora]